MQTAYFIAVLKPIDFFLPVNLFPPPTLAMSLPILNSESSGKYSFFPLKALKLTNS